MRIFISYGHDKYAGLANRIKKDLADRGHEIWFDVDRLKPGHEWENHIEDGINWLSEIPDESRILLLMTPHSVRRPDGYCLNEISRALSRNLNIIPVMVVWCEPPLSICRIQWLDMQDCISIDDNAGKYETKFERLVDALEKNNLDFEGNQSRLIKVLQPLSYDSDISSHLKRFTGREWVISHIDDWLKDRSAPKIFWLVGDPGVGKTTISAWLCHNRPEIIASHFCKYSDDYKSDPRRCVLSIAYQLSSQFYDYQMQLIALDLENIVKNSDANTLFNKLIIEPLSRCFPGQKRSYAILIDALDEATKGNVNELAEFIASSYDKMPSWIRLIITSRPDPEILQPLSGLTPFILDNRSKENVNDIKKYVVQELKTVYPDKVIPEETIADITEKSEGIFLYVTYVMRELKQGRISLESIRDFPAGLSGIYHDFFNRKFSLSALKSQASHDYAFYKQYCRPSLELISASSEPMMANEIAKILGWDDYEKNEALDSFGSLISVINGRVYPFHRSLVQWLTNPDRSFSSKYYISEKEGHKRLSDHGWAIYLHDLDSLPEYYVSYLPLHLLKASRDEDLKKLLRDASYFNIIWSKNEFDVKKLFASIENSSSMTILSIYKTIFDHLTDYPIEYLSNLSRLFADTGYPGEAACIQEYLIEYYGQVDDFENLQSALGNLGWSYFVTGENSKAGELFQKQEGICRTINHRPGLQMALGLQGNIKYRERKFDEAMELYKEQERICREIGDSNYLHTSLGNQGNIYFNKGEFEKALLLYEEKERICERTDNSQGTCISLGNQGDVYVKMGDKDKALDLFLQKEKISREIGYKYGIQSSLGEQANLMALNEEHEKSLELLRQQEEICRDIKDRQSLLKCLYNQSMVYENISDFKKALELYEEQEKICREMDDVFNLQLAFGGRGDIYYKIGELRKALQSYEEQEKICRLINNSYDLHRSLSGQGLIYDSLGDWQKSIEKFKEKESICRAIGDKFGTQYALLNIAHICYEINDLDRVFKIYDEVMDICREIGYKQGIQYVLSSRADICYDKGKWERALKTYDEHINICYDNNAFDPCQRTIGIQADIYLKKGEFDVSRHLYGKQEDICRITNNDELIIVLNKQALLSELKEASNAKKIFGEQVSLVKAFNPDVWIQRILLNDWVIHRMRNNLSLICDLYTEHEKLLDRSGFEKRVAENRMLEYDLFKNISLLQDIFSQIEITCRNMGHVYILQYVLSSQGIINYLKGDAPNALKSYTEQEKICVEKDYLESLLISLYGQARVHYENNEFNKALQFLDRHENICKDIGNKESLTYSLYLRACILDKAGEPDKALEALKIHEEYCLELGYLLFLQYSYGFKALILYKNHRLDEALAGFNKQADICRKMGYQAGLRYSASYIKEIGPGR